MDFLRTFQFENPFALLIGVAVPFIAWVLFRFEKEREPRMFYSEVSLFSIKKQGMASRLRRLPKYMRIIAIACMCIAVARPQKIGGEEEISALGIDIVIVLDVSTSMRAADFKPVDRLSVAKNVIKDFILTRQNDRVGLIIFAREAYTQCPITFDYAMVMDLLSDIETGIIEDATAIGNAIAVSVNRLRDSEAKSKIVILLTDGDNNAGNIAPLQAAEMAKEFGIKIYPILVGKGGEVPYPVGKDVFGKIVYDKVELPVRPELLQEISQKTEGKFYRATDAQALREDFLKIIDELEKTKLEEIGGLLYQEIFSYFLWPAVLLLFCDLGLSVTRLRRFP